MRLLGQFQACLFIFLRKGFKRTKMTKRKTNDFHLLRSFGVREKLLPFLFSVSLFLFCWFIFACDSVFVCAKSFRKKKKRKKKTGLKLS